MRYLGARIDIAAVAGALIASLVLGAPLAHAQAGEQVRVDEYSFVHSLYFHGIPYSDAHKLGSGAVPTLLPLLQNTGEQLYWVNVIVTIGFIGDTTAVHPLLTFLDEQRGEIDDATYRAVLSVPFALGCLAFAGSDTAYAYLVSRTTPKGWMDLAWSHKGEDVGILMTEQAVMGLGVSGRSEARLLLERIQERLGDLGPVARAQLADAAEEALRVNARIRDEGPEGYFGSSEGGR